MNFKDYVSLIEEGDSLITYYDGIQQLDSFVRMLHQHSIDLGSPKMSINIQLRRYQNENGPFVPRHTVHVAPPDGNPGPDVPQPIMIVHANPKGHSLIWSPGRWFAPMERRALTPATIAANFPTFMPLHSKPMDADKVWSLWQHVKSTI